MLEGLHLIGRIEPSVLSDPKGEKLGLMSGNDREEDLNSKLHLSCSDLGRTQNAGPTESAPLRTTRVPEPERLGPGSSAQGRPLIVPGGTT